MSTAARIRVLGLKLIDGILRTFQNLASEDPYGPCYITDSLENITLLMS